MRIKTDIEMIRMAAELRRRGYSLDIETQENKEFFRGGHSAMLEFMRKLQDIKYIESYIEMKAGKYMTNEEKEEWGLEPRNKNKLSDMINPCGHCDNDLISSEVKAAVKDFVDSFKSNYPKSHIERKAKEVFGDKLI